MKVIALSSGWTMIWLAVFTVVFVWSAIDPKDFPTWALEVLPAVIALFVLAVTRNSFPLTPLLYVLVLVHCIILMIGGHYTYAEVPAFDWLSEVFGWGRNNYDKVGHFAQGFIPAMVAREILVRNDVVRGRAWMVCIVLSICLAISAFYELIEWWVAVLYGGSAEKFLATQGYQWDTQSDMAMALIGAIIALLTLSRFHDRQLARISHDIDEPSLDHY
jgi:putative membrane protein